MTNWIQISLTIFSISMGLFAGYVALRDMVIQQDGKISILHTQLVNDKENYNNAFIHVNSAIKVTADKQNKQKNDIDSLDRTVTSIYRRLNDVERRVRRNHK